MPPDDEPPDRVEQGGRLKAYRPLPADARRAALVEAIDAYEHGDFFEAHELLEPAWMGTDDAAERELYQGLIKLAAAYVQAARGNAKGWRQSLENARRRLSAVSAASSGRPDKGDVTGLDVSELVEEVDRALDTGPAAPRPRIPSLRAQTGQEDAHREGGGERER
jgi:hypothetical protein